jgi:chromosome transmission fidelity protein 4
LTKVAAATDRRNLRFFTIGGFQREVLSLPGPVVALAGQGSLLVVAVHLSLPLPGNQSIGVAVFNMSGKTSAHLIPAFQPIPLSPKSTLAWIGLTDENNVGSAP